MECDIRSFPKEPIYKYCKHNIYKKYKSEKIKIYKDFDEDIIEYGDALFPNEYFLIKNQKTFDFLVFFTKIKHLELIK